MGVPLPPPGGPTAPGVRPASTDEPSGPQQGASQHSGPLLVTPPGTTLVATDALHALLDRLAALETELAFQTRRLVALSARAMALAVPGAPSAVRRSEFELQAAAVSVRSAEQLSARLVRAIRTAIAAYDDAETRALARGDRLAALAGAALGPLLRLMLPGIAVLGGMAFLASKLPDPGGGRAALVREFFLQHPGLITGPRFVEGVRMFTDGLDEATSSFLGVPAPVAYALGAAGITGIRSSARGLLTVGPLLGIFRETPVKVDRVSTTPVLSAPVGAVQRLDRVPEGNQVRIEKYEAPGQPPRYVVYVGPTETFSPVADHEPWDLTSNVGGVGGMDVGSFRASELAMRDAGITASDPVQFVGFSQGGLIATMLAGSGEWNAAGIQTFGAPAGNIELPEGLSGMAVRNTDDFVPMLAGPQLDHHVLQVERQAFADGTPLPTSQAAPAHQRDAYVATAAAVDQATSSAVREQNGALDSFTADYAGRPGAVVTAFTYHGERVPDQSAPLDPHELMLDAPATSSGR